MMHLCMYFETGLREIISNSTLITAIALALLVDLRSYSRLIVLEKVKNLEVSFSKDMCFKNHI